MNRLSFFLFWVFVCLLQPVHGQQDSVRVSLLTCAPGTEIYALFGHTALRYENRTTGEDWVFNYGLFSFDAPHFVYRFVKGETDYQLGVSRFSSFQASYAMRGSSVYQQELNLTSAEKHRLWNLLEANYRPENRVYRYNFFYDNCTSRARRMIEQCVDGKVVYPQGKPSLSFRGIVHEFTAGHPWSELGIDLCLGSEADEPIDSLQQLFAPFYMRAAAQRAQIVSNGKWRPLVLHETKIVDVEPDPVDEAFPLSPLAVFNILLGIAWLMGVWQYRRGRVLWGWDLLLFGAQGVAGCIIAFLFFVSTHPTVGSNWLILLLNPLPLCYLPWMIHRAIKGQKDLYHVGNVAYLTLFIMIAPFLLQEFNLSVLPLALSLLITSASHVILYTRKFK